MSDFLARQTAAAQQRMAEQIDRWKWARKELAKTETKNLSALAEVFGDKIRRPDGTEIRRLNITQIEISGEVYRP